MPRRPDDEQVKEATAASRERLAAHPEASGRYVLRLYVTGMTQRSMQAIANLRGICEKRLQGRYELEVVDIYQHPGLTRDEQIVAVPTLIKRLPPPLRRVVGDLSDEERVLLGLDVRAKHEG